MSSFKHSIAGLAVAAMALLGTAANAVTISGAIDIGGEVTVASTASLTEVDFVGDGIVLASSGDFAGLNFSPVTLTDIVFAAPGDIWAVAGFEFAATGFLNIMPNLQGGKDFTAVGILTAPGFDPTDGTFFFSSQSSGVLASFSSSTVA